MKLVVPALAAVAVIGLAATPAFAVYPANATYDTTREATITGVITEIQDIAPHPRLLVTAKAADGSTGQWRLQIANFNVLRRQGVRVKDEIKPGESYTFAFAPAWNGDKAGWLTAITIKGRRIVTATL